METSIIRHMGSKLLTKEGEVDLKQRLAGVELIGIYFSAHWCPPCRKFTPVLADFYNKTNEGGKRLEIIFISHDRDEDSFNDYYDGMPWTAIPFNADDERHAVINEQKVNGIPKLVFLNSDGSLKCEDGREKVSNDAANFPWS